MPKPPSLSALFKDAISTRDKDKLTAVIARDDLVGNKRAEALLQRSKCLGEPAEHLADLEAAWEAMPNKKSKKPGHAIQSRGLVLALEQEDRDAVVRWFTRMSETQPPYMWRQDWQRGRLGRFSSELEIKPLVEPKQAKPLLPHLEEIRGSLRGTCSLNAFDSSARPRTQSASSGVGGHPHMANGTPWPTDGHGKPMLFLLQLNFADTKPLPGFPSKGLLALFVPSDPNLGGRFDGGRGEYAAVWLEDPAAGAAQPPPEGVGSVCSTPGEIRCDHLELQPALPGDVHFEHALPSIAAMKTSVHRGFKKKFAMSSQANRCHRLGGYAMFTQEDPRKGDTADYIQLVQLDSYQPWGLQFGDGGIAHFFIHPDDLAALRFDRMLYSWDCA